MTITAVSAIQTPQAIRAYFANDLNDVNFAKRVQAHDEPKVVLCGNYDNRLMYRALCEGTLGRTFRTFVAENPDAAMRVIHVALVFWGVSDFNPNFRASQGKDLVPGLLYGMGAYAHHFTEMVAEMAEPHLPAFVNHFGQNAWMCDAWAWFAQNVAK